MWFRLMWTDAVAQREQEVEKLFYDEAVIDDRFYAPQMSWTVKDTNTTVIAKLYWESMHNMKIKMWYDELWVIP